MRYVDVNPGTCQTNNIYKIVSQFENYGNHFPIPDLILYINGIPLVVFELKTVIEEEIKIKDAFDQLTIRYRRDIPELLKYNAFLVISDGVNTKSGALFSAYEFFYAWNKITGYEKKAFHVCIDPRDAQSRAPGNILHHFILFPDNSKREIKMLARYPQYYAVIKLYDNIVLHQKPKGDGKGGTYFGATGCGKSFTMLFLSRLLMSSTKMASPTIIIISDRTDLDDQLSKDFTNAKSFIGDDQIINIESRVHLCSLLKDRESGGVFLTTVQKFFEDTEVLTERNNVICISDEAHRSQVNLDLNIKIDERGVRKSYGFPSTYTIRYLMRPMLVLQAHLSIRPWMCLEILWMPIPCWNR